MCWLFVIHLQEVSAAAGRAGSAAAGPAQHSSHAPLSRQPAPANNRKRTAEGLHAELASLDAVTHWDPQKQRNLDAFFQRMAAHTSGTPSHGEKAAKRHKSEWSAGGPLAFSLGHNKARPAAPKAASLPGFRAPSPTPWCACEACNAPPHACVSCMPVQELECAGMRQGAVPPPGVTARAQPVCSKYNYGLLCDNRGRLVLYLQVAFTMLGCQEVC